MGGGGGVSLQLILITLPQAVRQMRGAGRGGGRGVTLDTGSCLPFSLLLSAPLPLFFFNVSFAYFWLAVRLFLDKNEIDRIPTLPRRGRAESAASVPMTSFYAPMSSPPGSHPWDPRLPQLAEPRSPARSRSSVRKSLLSPLSPFPAAVGVASSWSLQAYASPGQLAPLPRPLSAQPRL